MSKVKTIKDYQKELRELRKVNNELWETIKKLNRKNREMREWIEGKFNWWIDLLEEKNTPNLPWLIRNTKDVLVRTK